MWLHYPWLAGAQSTTAAVANASTATTTSATTTYSGTPYLVIHDVADMVSCGTGQIYWNVYNEDASKYNITVYAVNEGVDQVIESPSTTVVSSTSATSPSSSAVAQTSSAAATTSNIARSLSNPVKRTTLSINTTIITQYANHGYGWTPVRLPEGNYRIYGHVYDGYGTSNTSNVFTVRESTNTSCLTAFAAMSKTATATLSSGKVTGSAESVTATASSGAAAGGTENDTGSNGLSGGAIAGIVIGVVAGLAFLAGLLFCLRRRRQQARRGARGDDGHPMGMTHRRMASASTAPSDPGHSPLPTMSGPGARGGPIPLGATAHDKSFTSSIDKDSEESFGQATAESAAPIMLAGTRQEQEEEEMLREDPFRSPALPPSQNPSTVYPQSTSTYDPTRRYSNPAGALPADQPTRTSRTSSQPSSPQRLPRRSPSGSGSVNSSPNPGESPRVGALGRTPSSRRKPVPSLGPELRGELAKKADNKSQEEGRRAMADVGLGMGNVGQGHEAQSRRTSYQLMPDPPLAPTQE
ncbi:hypothetical protein B9479_002354 [Cryptococcus floricola]|uniref:Mid2 domain-containing protein n=1 Tax=Cryptococcus floricola TaxID=2591691 RepID=A0A5D3B2Y5_9TREE|nr:hypothetical protein B9479_002354 [Cryptococcus floricola]